MAVPDSSALQEAIISATTRAWEHLVDNFESERIYGFALFTNDACQYITCTAFSEVGLSAVVAQYDGRATERDLRFSPADSPLHLEGGVFFEELVDPHLDDAYLDWEDDEAYNQEVERRYAACFSALRALDEAGLFDRVGDRFRFVLNVLQGDQSDNSRAANAEQLNPPSALAWYRSHLATSDNETSIAAVGDGRHYQVHDLLVDGDRVLIAESSVQLVRHVGGAEFRPEGAFGTGVHALAIGPDEDTVWMAAEQGLVRTSLAKPHIGDLICEMGDMATSVVPSPDGQYVLGTTFNQLEMFTADGLRVWNRETDALHPRCAWQPGSCRLFGILEVGAVWLDSATGQDLSVVDARRDGTGCAFSVDGSLVAIGFGHDYDSDAVSTVKVYRIDDVQQIWVAELTGQWSIADLDFNAKNELLLGGSAGTAFVYDSSGALVASTRCRLESISAARWVDDDLFLLCGRDVDTGPPALAFSVARLSHQDFL